MPTPPPFFKVTAIPLILFATIAIVTTGYFLKEITFIDCILLTLFGSITAIAFYRFFQMITSGRDSLGVERSLPSIDGSVSGWRLTSALSMLLITCVFAVLSLFVLANADQKHRAQAAKKHSVEIDSLISRRVDSLLKIRVKDSVRVAATDSQLVN